MCEESPNTSCYTATYVEVAPTAATAGATALVRYRDATRGAVGARRVDVLQRLDRANQFAVLATWENAAAFERHAASGAVEQLTARLAPLLVAPSDTRQHQGLAVRDAAPAPDGAMTVVTHVDVIPPEKDNGVAALVQLAAASRQHAGNRRFDVWQQTNRPNHFTVVETWSSHADFDAHCMAPATRDFRARLATMTGALYDERLYRTLA